MSCARSASSRDGTARASVASSRVSARRRITTSPNGRPSKQRASTPGGETAVMGHQQVAVGEGGAKAEGHIVRRDRSGRRVVQGLVYPIGGDELRDRLQVRHDHAQEPVIAQHAAKLDEGAADLMLVEVLDAMRGPHRIGRTARDPRQIGEVRDHIRAHRRIRVHPQLPPAVEQGRDGAFAGRTAADIDEQVLNSRAARGGCVAGD